MKKPTCAAELNALPRCTLEHVNRGVACEDCAKRCHPDCWGWLHQETAYGKRIEACDECRRWDAETNTEADEMACRAHATECGCNWPEKSSLPLTCREEE